LQGNPVLLESKVNNTHFVIKHYAGQVDYDTTGFMEKNKDTLTADLLGMIWGSQSWLVQVLFPREEATGKAKKSSLSKEFQLQLNTLMACLNETEPHYVRCVKPNPDKAPLAFLPRMCLEQLTYSGVFEAVAIRKQGFPFRLTHTEFVERYRVLMPSAGQGVSGCQQIISEMGFPQENVQAGRTMMLYRADEHKKLELERSIKVKTVEVEQDLARVLQVNFHGLDTAQKEQYFEDLAMCVRMADDFRMESANTQRARTLLEQLIEERMDPHTKQLLTQGQATGNKQMIEQGLEKCMEMGYRTALTRLCKKLLDGMDDAEEACQVGVFTRSSVFVLRVYAIKH
jgi:myosin heavy subunit